MNWNQQYQQQNYQGYPPAQKQQPSAPLMPSAPQQPQGMYQTPQPSSQFGQQQFPGVSQTYSPQPSSQFGQQSGSGFGMQQQQYPSVPQTQSPQPSTQFGQQQQQQFPGVAPQFGQPAGYPPQSQVQQQPAAYGQQASQGYPPQQFPAAGYGQQAPVGMQQPSSQFGQQQQQQFPGVAPQYGQAAGYPQAQSYGGQPYASKPKSADDLTPQELFAKVDKYKTGLIGINELKDAFKLLGSKFSEECIRTMMTMADTNYDSKISVVEFEGLMNYLKAMKFAFQETDADDSGTLDQQEVYVALQQNGFNLTQTTFDRIFLKFDRKKKGNLSYDDYIELVMFAGMLRNSFKNYDPMSTGRANMSIDDFTLAVTKIFP